MPAHQSLVGVVTHVKESAVIAAPYARVWEQVRPLTFKWLSAVKEVKVVDGNESQVGSQRKITYVDGTVQTVRVLELSDVENFVTYEVVSSEPAVQVSSAIHTIRLRRVTADDSTFVEWVSDYSSDASQEVIQDSKYKKHEAFTDLSKAVSKVVDQTGGKKRTAPSSPERKPAKK
ncbi:hypothetical protein MP228_007999 [Amoeboaphelidium protococcarum]|nr:hypothetical protein MP228_007999 [Amoeboaphelidium protococcarum]